MVTRFFKPTAVGIILFLFAAALQLVFTQTTGMTAFVAGAEPSWWKYETAVGIPTLVTIHGSSEPGVQRSWQIYWLNLVALFVVMYGLIMPFGRWLTGLTPEQLGRNRGWRHPAAVLIIVFSATVLLATVAAGAVSKWYWGYVFSRPALDHRLAGATTVHSITPVFTHTTLDGRLIFVRDVRRSFDHLTASDPDGDYDVGGRGVRAIHAKGLRTAATIPPRELAPLYTLVAQTGRLDPGEPAYAASAASLNGDIIRFTGAEGTPLLYIAVSGGQVSNDHYPYYEFLFDMSDEAQPRLLSVKHFYYDLAGIEGFEGLPMVGAFSVIGLLLVTPLTLLIMSVRRLVQRQKQGRGFPVEIATPIDPGQAL